MSDKNDPLDKYSGKPYPPLQKKEQAPHLVKADTEYKAVEEIKRGGRSPRFRIVDAEGVSYGCSYSHLLDWVFTPPSLITLNTATRVFSIQGKFLKDIERLLLEERIKALHVFNIKHHIMPESDEPIIESLEINEQ